MMCQQFHQYQQNGESLLILTELTENILKKRDILTDLTEHKKKQLHVRNPGSGLGLAGSPTVNTR